MTIETKIAVSTPAMTIEIKTFESGKYSLKLNGKKVALKTFGIENGFYTVPDDTEIILNGRKLRYIGRLCELFDYEYIFADENGNGARSEKFDGLLWILAKFGTHDVSEQVAKIINNKKAYFVREKVGSEMHAIDAEYIIDPDKGEYKAIDTNVFNFLPELNDEDDADDELIDEPEISEEPDTTAENEIDVDEYAVSTDAQDAAVNAEIEPEAENHIAEQFKAVRKFADKLIGGQGLTEEQANAVIVHFYAENGNAESVKKLVEEFKAANFKEAQEVAARLEEIIAEEDARRAEIEQAADTVAENETSEIKIKIAEYNVGRKKVEENNARLDALEQEFMQAQKTHCPDFDWDAKRAEHSALNAETLEILKQMSRIWFAFKEQGEQGYAELLDEPDTATEIDAGEYAVSEEAQDAAVEAETKLAKNQIQTEIREIKPEFKRYGSFKTKASVIDATLQAKTFKPAPSLEDSIFAQGKIEVGSHAEAMALIENVTNDRFEFRFEHKENYTDENGKPAEYLFREFLNVRNMEQGYGHFTFREHFTNGELTHVDLQRSFNIGSKLVEIFIKPAPDFVEDAIETLDADMKDEVRAELEPFKAEYNAAFKRLEQVENKIFNANGHKIGVDNSGNTKTDDFAEKMAELTADLKEANAACTEAIKLREIKRKEFNNACEATEDAEILVYEKRSAIAKFGRACAKDLSDKLIDNTLIFPPTMLVIDQEGVTVGTGLEPIEIFFPEANLTFYISTDWIFLGEYDTPEQVEAVISELKAAIKRGDEKFTFPTVEELSGTETSVLTA